MLEEPTEKLLREIFSYLKKLYSLIISKHFEKFKELEEMVVKELSFFLLNLEE